MEPQAKSHRDKIANFPEEVRWTMCQYLSFHDIASICTAFPEWESVLLSKTQHSYMNKLKWIDKRACKTLLSHSQTLPLSTINECTKQHFKQMKRGLQFSSIPVPERCLKRVDCILIKSIKTSPTLFPLRVAPWLRMKLPVKIANSTCTTTVAVRIFRSSYYNFVLPYILGLHYRQLVDNEYIRLLCEETDSLDYYDCVFYVIELSALLRQSRDIRTELRSIMAKISSIQTFGIIIIEDVKCKEESGLKFLLDCAKKLIFMSESRLMSAPMNWRVWCVQEEFLRLQLAEIYLNGLAKMSF